MTATGQTEPRDTRRRERASLTRLVARCHGYQRAMLLAGGALVALVVIVAVFAPMIAPYGYGQLQDGGGYFGSQAPPSARHWLGTTVGGYDVLSRVIWGAQTALEVVIAGTVAAVLLGSLLGLVSGYLGGWLDGVLVIVADGLYAFPALLLAIVMSIVISGGASGRWSGIFSAAVTVTVIFIPQYFRVVRAETVRLKQEPFIDAARVVGVPVRRILLRHILANSTRSLPLILTLNAGAAVATLAGLGFLGFGIQPTAAAEWGYDLNRAQSDIAAGIWWTGLFPGLAIAVTVLGLTLLGEGINDVRDPRLRARRRPRARKVVTARDLGPAQPGAGPGAAAGTAPLLDIDSLGVSLTTDEGVLTAVRGLSLQVRAGEIVAIVGESGSGKTVTARAALRLLPSTAAITGAVRLAGQDVLDASRGQLRRLRGRGAAMIFQDPGLALNPVYPVGWQIAQGLRARGHVSRRDALARAVVLLGLVGIPEPERRVRHYPHQFSGGQQQRLGIAAALALDPPLLVADEPTTALDVTVQAGILDLLRQLRDTQGTSILLITHNMGVVADLADRVLVMQDGRVVEENATGALFAQPREDYTRQLLAAVPRLGQRGESAGGPSFNGPAPQADPGAETQDAVVAERLIVDYPGRFGQPSFRAVNDVTFRIRPGEVVGLVGESGSGKTTIARAIAGLVPPSGGRLRVLGQELAGDGRGWQRTARRDIGFVFQDPAASFDPKLTIGESVAEPIRVHDGADSRDVRSRVDALLESVLLRPEHAQRYPHELSGGQRQRAGLARALALRPRLLIADEPTSALDVSVQKRILELIRVLQGEQRFAVLFISHDLAVIDGLADTVGVLYHGQLVEYGDRYQVLAHPGHEYTRQLIAASPVPDPAQQAVRRAARSAGLEVAALEITGQQVTGPEVTGG